MRSHLRLASLSVVLACIVLHAIVSFDPFPGWGDDPTRLPAALSSLGPAGSAVVDVIMTLFAALAIVFAPAGKGRGGAAWLAASSVGAASALFLARSGSVDDLALSMNWSAALFGGTAIGLSARDAACRRVASAVLLGLVGLLATRAAVQYFVENPEVYRDFQRSKKEILAAHGWAADSPLARSFERRVSQPDAGGWFGLSNVLGSVAAGSGVAFLALLLRTWTLRRARRESSDGVSLVFPAAGLAASIAALAFSMSKGAIMAAIGGTALVAISRLKLRPMVARVLGIACIVGPLALVIVRGVIGDRLHELSLWFRWFYMQGATRIILGPGGWKGVGPGGFQDEYMRLKPPISPENVTSPHSVLLDCLAAFGVFGLAWVVWIAMSSLRAGESLGVATSTSPREPEAPSRSLRSDLRLVMAIAVVPTLLAAFREREIATEWSTAIRLMGLCVFGLAAFGVLAIHRRDSIGTRIAMAAGALTLLAHAQIDMVATTTGSSAWFFGMLALAAAPFPFTGAPVEESSPAGDGRSFRDRMCLYFAAAAVLAGLGWRAPALARLWNWESELRGAALLVRPIPLANVLATNTRLGSERERLDEAAGLLSDALGRRIEPTRTQVAAAVDEASATLVDRAIPMLLRACDLMPDHFGTQRATSELLLTRGLALGAAGNTLERDRLLNQSRELVERFVQREQWKSTAWAWLGLLNRKIADQGTDREASARALDAYLSAVRADPYGVVNIPPLVEVQLEHGLTQDARKWAAEGLARNARLSLDPMAQLSEAQVQRLRTVAESP